MNRSILIIYFSFSGLAAFVANGSILPRASGASDTPMNVKEAVPFQSPSSMEVELLLPNRGSIKGMGIKKGINLIVGGGFHGKKYDKEKGKQKEEKKMEILKSRISIIRIAEIYFYYSKNNVVTGNKCDVRVEYVMEDEGKPIVVSH